MRTQEKTSDTSKCESEQVCKFTCPHIQCGHKFLTKHGMLVHAGKCEFKDLRNLGKIVEHKGPAASRLYRVRWQGFDETDDTWQQHTDIHPTEVTAYEESVGVYDFACQHRCRFCNQPCKSDRGRKIHESRMHKNHQLAEKTKEHALGLKREQDFENRLADSAVKVNKMKEAQKNRRPFTCSGKQLENSNILERFLLRTADSFMTSKGESP